MICTTCGKELHSEFANFGTSASPQCWDCSMVARDRAGLTLD